MERVRVRSSNVAAVSYEEEGSFMDVEFHNGGLYRYHGVPRREFEDLVRAPSVGSHLHARIKPNFRYTQLA